MKDRKLAILKDQHEDFIRVYSPYSRVFVQYLKASVPPADREPVFHETYDGRKRFSCWRIRRIYLNDIVKLMNDFWPDQEIESDLVEDSDWIDEMFRSIPDNKVDFVYRALAQCLHPDVGGNEELMKRLNLAYQRRKSE
jgi:hypothetical protein